MRRISVFLFLWCVMGAQVCWAQGPVNHEIRFSGVVINRSTTLPVPNVNCRQGNAISRTDLQGRFALVTAVGDSIHFSHVGFKPYDVVVPDSLTGGEYILAIFMSSDTVHLPEVVVRRRYGEQTRQYRMNAINNMAGVERDAFSSKLEMTPEQNQKRVLDDFAASTNKGHVDVKLGVGLESYRAYRQLRTARKFHDEPLPLEREEIDLLKMIFSINHRQKDVK